MLSLQCPAQNYAWGRPAGLSEVAQLAKANGVQVDEDKPFAELWMGTHPSGPALLAGTTQTLSAWISAHPEALGPAVISRFGQELPYLFKVLSVQTALSIQSHPDKRLAEKLHASNPKDYKDDNHKPEMALALQDFTALCGFVTLPEIQDALRRHGELRGVVGSAGELLLEATEETYKPALKAAFTSLMTADAALVAGAVTALAGRLQQEAGCRQQPLGPKEQLVLKLNQQYPKDVGVLSAFFLNLVALPSGHAIYLAANEPHAYVSGELVECMAASDNVIRAGLTPKFRDTAVLCESLTYNTGLPQVLTGDRVHDHVRVYRPPFEEFEVQLVDVPAGQRAAVPVNPGPLLLLVQQGSGSAAAAGGPCGGGPDLRAQCDLRRGSVLFVPARTQLTYTASPAGPLKVWVAAVNAAVFVAASAGGAPEGGDVGQQDAAAAVVEREAAAAAMERKAVAVA